MFPSRIVLTFNYNFFIQILSKTGVILSHGLGKLRYITSTSCAFVLTSPVLVCISVMCNFDSHVLCWDAVTHTQ